MMKLNRLTIHRLPGFEQRGFTLQGFSPKITIIVGPNGCGKSSICRAIRALLWPQKNSSALSLVSEWIEGDNPILITLEANFRTVNQKGSPLLEKLPDHHLAPCFLLSLDDLFHAEDQQFAGKIAQELLGGYDLLQATDRLFRPLATRASSKEWNEARTNYASYQNKLVGLQEEKLQLLQLEETIASTHEAIARATHLKKILIIKKCRSKVEELLAICSAFPKQLRDGKISFEDGASYERLHGEGNRLEGRKGEILASINKLEQEISFHFTLPEDDDLEREGKRIDYILQLEEELKRYLIPKIEAEKIALSNHRLLLSLPEEKRFDQLRQEGLDKLEELWEKGEESRSTVNTLQEVMEALSPPLMIQPLEPLSQTLELLLQLTSRMDHRLTTLFASFGFIFFAFHEGRWLFLLLGLLPALLDHGYTFFQTKRKMKKILSHYETLQRKPPQDFTPPSLHRELISLTEEIKEIESQKRLQEEYDKLRRRCELEKERERKTRELLLQSADAWGIGQLPIESRYRFASYIKKLHDGWIFLQQAEREKERLELTIDQETLHWLSFAKNFGEESVELRKSYSRIQEKIRKGRELSQRRSEAEEISKTMGTLQLAIFSFLQERDCSTPLELRQLLNQLPAYLTCKNDLQRLQLELIELEQQLAESDLARIDEPVEQIEKELMILMDGEKELLSLREKRAVTQSKLQEAENSTMGQKLLEKEREAFQSLKNCCSHFTQQNLLKMLIDEIQEEFEREFQPPLIERASVLFRRFTNESYRLEPPHQPRSSFFQARECATREIKGLHELSRGTRIQLLLAVRLSFALEEEQKLLRLPFFLDEPLANSDEERSSAIRSVLQGLAEEDHQIIYLTSNWEEALRWQEEVDDLSVIDLHHLRKEESFVRAALPRRVKESTKLPEPTTLSLEEYAIALKVPKLSLAEPIELASTFYLVETAADLYRLQLNRIETIGHFQSVEETTLIETFPHLLEKMRLRAQLLERFHTLKNQGRGKPLHREALEQSPLPLKWMEPFWEISQEVGYDAKKLLERLSERTDRRVKGVRAATVEELQNYCTERGYLDEREVLGEEEIRHRLLPLISQMSERELLDLLFTHTS